MEQHPEGVENKNEPVKKVEFHLPIIMLKTRLGIELMTRIGRFRPVKYLAWVYVAVFPLLTVVGIYLIVSSIILYLSVPAAGQAAREAGPLANLLIPGLNPYLPVVYGWIAIVLAIFVHEMGHGIMARSLNFLVKSAGLLFLIILPIGAFVEPDGAAMKRAKLKDAIRILAAGVGGNLVTALIFLLLIMAIVSSLMPVTLEHGLGVVGVYENYPAYDAGLQPGAILISVNNQSLIQVHDLDKVIGDLKPNETVSITFALGDRVEHKMVLLAEHPTNSSRGFLGIEIVDDPELKLEAFKQLSNSFSPMVYLLTPTILFGPYLIPYSHVLHVFYTSPIGDWFYPLSNMFYWIWFVNFNVAIFNALPIYPLDGGDAISRVIRRLGGERLKESTANRLTYIISIAMVFLIIMMLALPYLPTIFKGV